VRSGAGDKTSLDAWTLAAGVLALAHFLAFPWRVHPLVTDVRHFVYFAQQTAAGALPHLDLFDNKTQLATFAGAILVRLGGLVGLDPVYAIRLGYLALAALGATLAFQVQRHLFGRLAAGAFGLACVAAFALLGLLPAIGNIPKLLMAVMAAVTALCARRGAWMAAGAAGSLAALDWQIGALALIGALVASLREDRWRRARAVGGLAGGTALVVVPMAAVYAWRGALGPLVRQTVMASLFRAAATRARTSGHDEWHRRWGVVTSGCGHEVWLLAVALAGGVLFLRCLLRTADDPARRRLLTTLAVYHYGVVAYSLWDFQVYGDLFILLHSVAFFAAVAASGIDRLVQSSARLSARGRQVGTAIALVAAFAVARPWIPRGRLRVPGYEAGPTLADQADLATHIDPLLASGGTAVLGPSEQLVLTRRRNPVPVVYWNAPAYAYYRSSPEEDRFTTLRRLLDGAGVTRVVCERGAGPCPSLPGYGLERTVTGSGGTAVDVYSRAPR